MQMKTMKMALLSTSNISNDIWKKRSSVFQSFLHNRLVVTVSNAIHLIELDKITFLSSDSNYCNINLENGQSILSSKTLKYYELALLDKGFLRIHSGFLINLTHLSSISKDEGYQIILNNGETLPISRSFKAQLFTGRLLKF